MTQVKQNTIYRFRKAFPEMSKISDVEVMAYCRDLKREKKKVDRSIERKIRSYR